VMAGEVGRDGDSIDKRRVDPVIAHGAVKALHAEQHRGGAVRQRAGGGGPSDWEESEKVDKHMHPCGVDGGRCGAPIRVAARQRQLHQAHVRRQDRVLHQVVAPAPVAAAVPAARGRSDAAAARSDSRWHPGGPGGLQ
jgi:hypothetical protein